MEPVFSGFCLLPGIKSLSLWLHDERIYVQKKVPGGAVPPLKLINNQHRTRPHSGAYFNHLEMPNIVVCGLLQLGDIKSSLCEFSQDLVELCERTTENSTHTHTEKTCPDRSELF